MEWRKPAELRYTQLCMYIDANIEKLRNPGEYPEVEDKIYNYLWLLVKALAIKKRMFQNFEDYDPYSFYAANRLFFALRKNLTNTGKIIKGKLIRPIKSSLNYTKTLLYPMKIEYQRETYKEIIDGEFTAKKFDSFAFNQKLQESAKSSQLGTDLFPTYLKDLFQGISKIIDETLDSSPFRPDTLEYKHIKITVMLNYLNDLPLHKVLAKESQPVVLWKLPKSMTNYIKVLIKEINTNLKKEIMECYSSLVADDAVAEQILRYREGNDYDYGDDD